MGAVVLDASVLIALLDPRDALSVRAVDAMSALPPGTEVLLPASAFAETLVAAFRRGETDRRRAQIETAARVVPLSAEIAVTAAGLRARPRPLRLPDALVVATGEVLGATVLTGDRSWTRHSTLVEVI